MRFDDDADDPALSGVRSSGGRDVRGSRVPGGGATVGGGIAGVVALVLGVLFGVGPEELGLTEGGPQPASTSASASRARVQPTCGTEECRTLAVVDSVQDYWRQEFARRDAVYRAANTVFFTGRAATATACGAAKSAVGPFYCPGDRKVYLDLGFFDELRTRFGSSGGPFAQAYVVAHAYGHHVQNQNQNQNQDQVSSMPARARGSGQRAGSSAVRTELQADCYAGVWARHSTRTPEESTGRPLISSLSDQDIKDGLDAAAAVGDDRVRARPRGRTSPESWTHGSARERQQWFHEGFRTGDTGRCDAFAR